jgi:hypothetical protein
MLFPSFFALLVKTIRRPATSRDDTRSLNDMAADALEEARRMTPVHSAVRRSKRRHFSVELPTIAV